MYFRGVLGMNNKLLVSLLVLSSCFGEVTQESFAVPSGLDPILNLNAVRDGKKILYCEPDRDFSSCFVFNKTKNNVVGLFFMPGNFNYSTCFYGQISKKYSNILVGTGYEEAEYEELFSRNTFKPSIQSDRLKFSYKKFVIDKTRKKVKFLGATINFDAWDSDQRLKETPSDSYFYKKNNLKDLTPDPINCSKIKF
jgi:hypothetical protein